jgi:hypothetical protein
MSEEVEVFIPDESHSVVRFRQDGHVSIALINRALANFGPGAVFRWHLSVLIQLQDLVDDRMPSVAERALLDSFGDRLDQDIRADHVQPNALFLARITWNATRELIYRVLDPDRANELLQHIIRTKSSPREFDFRMDDDSRLEARGLASRPCSPREAELSTASRNGSRPTTRRQETPS